MIYLVGIICGVLNGLFAAAAGQIMVFYLAFVLKLESHVSRATSIFCMSLATIITFIGYIKFVKIKFYQIIIVVICGFVFGIVGSKAMNKIQSNYLNLISGLLIFGLGVYKLIVK